MSSSLDAVNKGHRAAPPTERRLKITFPAEQANDANQVVYHFKQRVVSRCVIMMLQFKGRLRSAVKRFSAFIAAGKSRPLIGRGWQQANQLDPRAI